MRVMYFDVGSTKVQQNSRKVRKINHKMALSKTSLLLSIGLCSASLLSSSIAYALPSGMKGSHMAHHQHRRNLNNVCGDEVRKYCGDEMKELFNNIKQVNIIGIFNSASEVCLSSFFLYVAIAIAIPDNQDGDVHTKLKFDFLFISLNYQWT